MLANRPRRHSNAAAISRRQRPLLDTLERRALLATFVARPGYVLAHAPVGGPVGGAAPLSFTGPVGYTPQELQTAYGVNLIRFGAIKGDGTGQTIALIDAGDNSGFQDTGPNYARSALQVFDATFGLPDPPSFTKYLE